MAPLNKNENHDTTELKEIAQHVEAIELGDSRHGTGSSNDTDPNLKQHGDRALAIVGSERIILTEEDNRKIRRKTDRRILTILVWIYLLQILDKSVLGYGAVFGLQTDLKLVGNQYSLVGSIAPIAQVCIQPFTSYLIVKVPHRILMPSLCLGWGIAQACMAGCTSYQGLLVARFFLGLFEGGCLPLFSVITTHWYRRAEQPLRVAAWYGTNGWATIFAAALSYGLGHIPSHLYPWQILFLFVGLVTIATAPLAYWRLDNDITSARFLTDHEKAQAIERLRANQTGTGSNEFKWDQVLEALLEPKTWLFIGLSILNNLGAQVTNTFGPLILQGLGFDKYKTSLLNMPFGAVQWLIILAASYCVQKFRLKSAVLAAFMMPVVAGLVMLYLLPRSKGNDGPLLAGYYLLAFLYGGIPIIVSWIVSNTAGTTKKSTIMSLYNGGASIGNIIGPLLFTKSDAPGYYPGLRKVLAVFIVMIVVVGIQVVNLMVLNKMQSKKRVRNGKPAYLKDHSMESRYVDFAEGNESNESGEVRRRLGGQAFLDITDRKNDEFVYVY